MERKNQIVAMLTEAFALAHLEVVNESHMHSVPPNSETHFKLVLVSEDFEGLPKVRRHQQVYRLTPLMSEGLHAVALHLHTPSEWSSKAQAAPSSPNCMGGSKSS
jgi:BolA protein